MKPEHRSTFSLTAFTGLTLVLTSAALHAQIAWDGGSGGVGTDYSTAANWAGDTIPGNGNANGASIGNGSTQTVIYNTAASYTSTGSAKANSLLVGSVNNGSNGSLTLSGSAGTLTFGGDSYSNAAWIGVADSTSIATGIVTVTAGKLAITGGTTASINLGVSIGGSVTGAKSGMLIIDGGTVDVNGRIFMGANSTAATGVLTISSGGTLDMKRANALFGEDLGMIHFGTGTNTVNLDGGTAILSGFHISAATNARSNIYFNGTTLKANVDNSDFIVGIAAGDSVANANLQIKNGGLIFDTNNFAVTINDTLSNFSGHTGILRKEGAGTLTLSGANTYTGTTTINAGTLVADTATNATVLSSSFGLVMGGGTFQLKGKAATVRSQTLNGLTAGAGASVVDVNNLGTSTTLDLRGSGGTLTINRNAGATVDFKATSGTLGTTALIQPGTTNTNGILGEWATVNGGTDFAANSTNTAAGYVVAATSTGGNLGDGGQASDTAMNFKPSGTQTDLTTTKSFNTLNFNGSTGATMTSSGAVTVEGGGLIYNSTGAITGGTLAGSASGELVLHTTQAMSLASTAIINNGGATALTKSGSATLTLGATNTYSGNTTVASGSLTLSASGSIASSPVISVRSGATLNVSAVSGGWSAQGNGISSRQTLTGAGGVTGAATIGGFGTHNAGDGGVGKQTFSSSLTYASGSIFEWNLATTPSEVGRGTSYDAVNATSLGATTNAIFRVVLDGAQNFTEVFWDTNRTWSDIFKTADAGSNLSIASIFSAPVEYHNSGGLLATPASQGYFTISGSNLSWTAVPEPTSALAGLLLSAGLLRRRRRNVG